ncbi:MAG: hypothetical protein GY796_21530 [Chloroflexi bacterium]|nr:hypothetical protein [Chloroflexota bacterium]
MRGTILFIMLLLLLGGFVIISEVDVVNGAVGATVVPASVGNTDVTPTKLVPIVDRDDDPPEQLPCSGQPNDCSLRSAITAVIQSAHPAEITFANHYIIVLTRPLPTITQAGLSIIARPGQEVRVNGNNLATPVFHITAANVKVEGLRIYGAGVGYANVLINGPAHEVIIARNVIGDDDAPENNCGQSEQSATGIYVQTNNEPLDGVRARIYGNIVECHQGYPGEGIVLMADGVILGVNSQEQAGPEQQNVVRGNRGVAIRLDGYGGNTIRNNLIYDNTGGTLVMNNFENVLMDNDIRQ